MEITGVDIDNTRVHVENTGVDIKTLGVQDIAHEYKNN